MKFKKLIVSIIAIMLIFFSFINPVQASLFDRKENESDKIIDTINDEDGGLFEKIIAKTIGGLAGTVFDLATKKEFGVGFKNYDELIFGIEQTDLSPFDKDTWNLIIRWYKVMATVIEGPILIAIVILAFKMIVAGMSPDRRNEAKDSMLRLFFGAFAIGLAPIFVKLLLLINNSLVTILVGKTNGSLDNLLGNSVLTSINTGNAIATAIVISLFAYLFVKLNIKFIIREFTLIVFIIFTPIVSIFWIINKRTIASSIWFGQIIINAFMQFVYAFLFLIYLTFLPNSSGWATSLLWAMMILPLGDTLQNTMQNLVSRVAGINNEELSNRGIGMGAVMGHTIKAIAYQFKGDKEEKNQGQDIISRVIKKVNNTESVPINSASYEEHSRNIMNNNEALNQTNIMENNNQNINQNNTSNNNSENETNNRQTNIIGGLNKAYNVGKEYMNFGMYMAEGRNFRNNNYENNRIYDRPNINNTRKEDKEEEKKTNIIIKETEDDADE